MRRSGLGGSTGSAMWSLVAEVARGTCESSELCKVTLLLIVSGQMCSLLTPLCTGSTEHVLVRCWHERTKRTRSGAHGLSDFCLTVRQGARRGAESWRVRTASSFKNCTHMYILRKLHTHTHIRTGTHTDKHAHAHTHTQMPAHFVAAKEHEL